MNGPFYHNHRLYTVEGRKSSSDRLCMYQVTSQELTLVDTVDLGVDTCCHPLVDGHNKQVYIPRAESRGVSVVSWDNTRLTTQRTLTCVGACYSVSVLSSHTLCACDRNRGTVSVVSVTDNTVTATLQKPAEVRYDSPNKIAVAAGNTILVMYGFKLVVYKNGVYSPGTMVPMPVGLQSVQGMSSDGVSRFLICDGRSNTVFILDVSGKLCHKINIATSSYVVDCTVGDGKLWVGSWNGGIVVLSPQ